MKIAFYEKGVAFETKMLDGSEAVAGEFAALWSIGKFPALALAAEWQQLGEPIGADTQQMNKAASVKFGKPNKSRKVRLAS